MTTVDFETVADATSLASCLNLSHELRTSAHAILGHVEIALSGSTGPLSADMRASLGHIQQAGVALLVQVDKVLAAADDIPVQPSHPSGIEHIASMLERAFSQTRLAGGPGEQGHRSRSDDDLPSNLGCWLQRVAAIIDELLAFGLVDLDPNDDPALGIRLKYHPSDRHRLINYLGLIETMLAMIGGALHEEEAVITLSWPPTEADAQPHSANAHAAPNDTE